MKKVEKSMNMSYEPEADVLRIEASRKPIEYAAEMGNAVVHFSPDGTPVYFEILEASRFLKQASLLPGGRLSKSLALRT